MNFCNGTALGMLHITYGRSERKYQKKQQFLKSCSRQCYQLQNLGTFLTCSGSSFPLQKRITMVATSPYTHVSLLFFCVVRRGNGECGPVVSPLFILPESCRRICYFAAEIMESATAYLNLVSIGWMLITSFIEIKSSGSLLGWGCILAFAYGVFSLYLPKNVEAFVSKMLWIFSNVQYLLFIKRNIFFVSLFIIANILPIFIEEMEKQSFTFP